MSEYRIITIANKRPHEWYYTFDAFFNSLHGEQVSVLGSQPGEYGGLGSKPRLLYSAIKNNQIPEKHIIFSDCFDVVFSVPPAQLFNNFLNYKKPFVIGAEKNCFPSDYKDEFDKLDSHGSSYKYLNSGMIVAETEAMLSVLESMDAANISNDYWSEEKQCMINPNDQEYYMKEYLKQPVPMQMDYWQSLCNNLNMVELDELEFNESGILNKEMELFPCSFHLNGGAKTGPCREPILKYLNLL